MTKNEEYLVRMEDATPEGFGVCRVEGRAVFVKGALPGEDWRIRIVKVTAGAVWARGMELLSPAACRRADDCPNPCGGCTLRHADYAEELRLKREYVERCLRRIGGIPERFFPLVIHPSLYEERYRNKAIFAVGGPTGKAEFGFYRPRSHDLVPIRDCLLQSENCLRAAGAAADFMNAEGIPAYDEASGKGIVRHLYWRESRERDAVLCFVAARGFGAKTGRLTEYLRESCPFLTGIVLNINKTPGNTILAGEFYTLWGTADVRERLCGSVFRIAPRAFLQINPPQAEKVYEKALEFAGGTDDIPAADPAQRRGGKLALDLYCGAGTITLALAKRFSRVIGAEIVPEAIENARENAAANGISNVEFVCADAAELRTEGLRPDVVVVDPPRKGLAEKVITDVTALGPERIVYVSCNPATLARDLKLFAAEGYVLQRAEAFDMFPRTAHIETIVLLQRQNS